MYQYNTNPHPSITTTLENVALATLQFVVKIFFFMKLFLLLLEEVCLYTNKYMIYANLKIINGENNKVAKNKGAKLHTNTATNKAFLWPI